LRIDCLTWIDLEILDTHMKVRRFSMMTIRVLSILNHYKTGKDTGEQRKRAIKSVVVDVDVEEAGEGEANGW